MKLSERSCLLDKESSNKITFLSFIMSIVIICYHLDPYDYFNHIISHGSMIDSMAFNLNNFFNMLGSIAVAYFFMTSGFLLYYNTDRKNIIRKLVGRITTLLIPYIIWNLIGFLFYEHSLNHGFYHIFVQFLQSGYCAQLWFVRELFILTALMPFIIYIIDKRLIGAIFLIAVLIASYIITSTLGEPTGFAASTLERIFRYLPIYFIGAYIGRNFAHEEINETYHTIKYKTICLVLLIISYSSYSSPIVWFIQRMQPIFLWVLLDKYKFKFSMHWYLQVSFYIYAIHSFIIVSFKKVGNRLGLIDSNISLSTAVLIRIGITLLTLLIAVISAFILIKIIPKLFKVLSGGRVPKILNIKR
jgi:surface polysaccharide O-acyltransferase-like enzyme